MLRRALISLTILTILGSLAIAQEVNDSLIAKQDLQLYASPPSGIPIRPGTPTFRANPGQNFRILEVKNYKAVFYTEIWINVLELNSPNPRSGWAYWGRSGTESPNFIR